MIDVLLQTLEKTGFPVYLQGTIAQEKEYDESFITYQITDSPLQDFLDDDATGTQWEINVIFYTSRADLLYSAPADIFAQLKAAGFIPQGKGFNIPSDEPTCNGYGNDFLYYERG